MRHRAPRPAALLAAVLLTALPLLATAQPAPADWPDPAELSFPPIAFDAPEPTRVTLSNGLRVYLAEDRSLPLISGVAYVDAPALLDPEGKTGLAGIAASMLREGGAGGRSPDAIDAELEFLAASVEASANAAFASVSFSALSDTLDEVLPIWRDVLIAPDFDAERLQIEKQRQLEAIRRVVDNPVQLAVREFYFRVAEGHPSGAYPTADTVGAIERADLIDFHDSYYAPETTVLAITGDFETDAMIALLEETLGGWDALAAPRPDLPDLDPTPPQRVFYAPKDIAQAIVLVGHPSVLAYSPAYNDLNVANDILGAGGFSSRIFTEIRTRRGLAYSAGSGLTQGFAYPGTFLAFAITPGEAAGTAIELLLAEIRRLQNEGVSADELERSRSTILNSSLFRDTSVAAVTQRTARVEILGLEPGYYERYLENLQSITPDEVQAVARTELRPDEAIILVVGNADLFDRPLSDFGEVVTIELE